MMMGSTEVVDEAITAYTDGINKKYGRAFLTAICPTQAEVNGLILHGFVMVPPLDCLSMVLQAQQQKHRQEH
jgi:hypothetical protein